ncbi:diguanylate cyclase [Ruminococcaceae bacterium OttesenSCG-928-I18]|nr:diguanylate cyclase [Ruminococcaceae bacterium OttesenSCG-928-I18]
MSDSVQMMFDYLRDVLYTPRDAHLDIEKLDEDLQEFAKGLVYFGESIAEMQEFATSLSKGNLSCDIPSRANELAAPLKALHASLVHLTWQTQQVAKGDYQQKVDFMGEFSEAFNVMTKQLDERQKALLATISEEKEQVQRLENYAYRDGLTGLHNRLYGFRRLQDWVDAKKHFCLCFIDIDNLKFVNDTYGHPEGDRYIIQIAQFMQKFSEAALVCRLGGDEFMILAEECSYETTEKKIAKIRAKIKNQENLKYIRSISYGIVEADSSNTFTAGDLLSIADERMYEFKRAHKAERKLAIDNRETSIIT